MKKLIFIILGLTLLSSITLKSQTVCATDTTILSKIDKLAEWAGQQHNLGLDAIYDSINVHISEFSESNPQSGFNTINRFIINYGINKGCNKDSITKYANLSLSKFLAYMNSNNSNDSLFLQTSIDSLYQAGDLSVAGKNCLLKIDSIINNATSTTTAIFSINELIKETKNGYKNKSGITNVNELFVVLSGLYVGEYSISYWDNNQTKWVNIAPPLQLNIKLNTMAAPKKNGFSWKTAGKEDVGGAVVWGVTTGVVTAAVNAIPGAGQVAWGTTTVSATLIGGIGTSGAYAWEKCKHFWGW